MARGRGLDRVTAIARFTTALLLGGAVLRRGSRRLRLPLAWLTVRPGLDPVRLVIAPQDIRTADPIVAQDIYAGFFAFAGRMVDAHGRSPFDLQPPSEAWSAGLLGFGWLRHLRAADTALARSNAQALVADFLRAPRARPAGVAWRPGVVARRLLSWLSQSPLILEGADAVLYRRLMHSIAFHAAFLQRHLRAGMDEDARLLSATAVAAVALCAENGRPFRAGTRLLTTELRRQVLDDGGPVSRDPARLVELLLDLLPLRQAYASRGLEVPAALQGVLDKMTPMLRLFRHGDGALALFNGMGVTSPDALATILAYDRGNALPLGDARSSGYQRVEAGPGLLICDTGVPPPPAFARRAHAGTLSFEFSHGAQRLVVNSGRAPGNAAGLVAASRATAAHSTLVLSDMSSAAFLRPGAVTPALDGALIQGPRAVPVTRRSTAEGEKVEASHDGYRALGRLHRRSWKLAPDGRRLEGEDRIVRAAGIAEPPSARLAIRFHLHPAVRPQAGVEGAAVRLALPDGSCWLFQTDGDTVALESSTFFGSAGGPQRTEQIVIEATAAPEATVRWAFTREA